MFHICSNIAIARLDRSTPGAVPPLFTPVPLRARAGGWTLDRQRAFIAALFETRSVARACRRIGASRASAYRLHDHPRADSFRAAWQAAAGGRGGTARPSPLPVPQGIARPWSLLGKMAAFAQAKTARAAETVSNQACQSRSAEPPPHSDGMCKPRKLRLDPREVSRLASLGSDRLHAFLLKVDPRYRAEIAKIEAGERAAPREGGEA